MVGNINISLQHNIITIGERTCRLQPKVMALLHYLAQNKDRVINNDELLDHVWNGRIVTNSSIQKCVNALRAAFIELDSRYEYVVYFSKRGYQLVTPPIEVSPNEKVGNNYWRGTLFIAPLTLLVIYLIYHFEVLKTGEHPPENFNVAQFTQVKPYASNTGREQIIEPHSTSERVAFIRDERPSSGQKKESHLFIQGTNGKEWQVSVARGRFISLAWSHSGRNLVAIDFHHEYEQKSATSDQQKLSYYYTFHIYTLDFKGERLIEKNILSHWQSKVSSVSWWGEDVLEFTASQGDQYQRMRFRYGIADQNLSMIKAPTDQGKLLSSHVFNKNTATLSILNTNEQIQFLDAEQQLIGEWPIPFKVLSMSWITDEVGVLLVSANNQLSILHTDGSIQAVDYSPKVNGRIKQARTKNKGKNLVLTVEAPSSKESTFSYPLKLNTEIENNVVLSQKRFMKRGGGFIYSQPDL